MNDQRCHRDGERFYCLLEVPNAAGAVETNITILAVGGGLVRAASGTVYVADCDEAVSHADRGVIEADSRYTYEFDGFGRLISVTSSNAAPAFRLCFGYDADGRRAWKRVLGWTGAAWATNRTHAFVYDGWNLVAERITGSGTSTCFYTWGLDLAGQKTGKLGQQAGGIGGLLAITEFSGSETNVYVPVCDHIGTIRGVADTNGALVAKFEYSPFGVLVREWYCSPLVRQCLGGGGFRFSTKYYDSETELLYYGHRYYDPASTKWLSRDPIGERGGVNLTQFCHGDPVDRYDAVGLWDVFREGGPRATVRMSSEMDTDASLARLVRLDEGEIGKWRKTVNGDTTVPNTVVIVVGDHLLWPAGPIVRWHARQAENRFRAAGFQVVMFEGSRLAEGEFMETYIRMHRDVWGFMYFGHGYVGDRGAVDLGQRWLRPSGTRSKAFTAKKTKLSELLTGKAKDCPRRGWCAVKNSPLWDVPALNYVPLMHEPTELISPQDVVTTGFRKGLIAVLSCYSNEGQGSEHWSSARAENGKAFTVQNIDFAPFGYWDFEQCTGATAFFEEAIPPPRDGTSE